MFACRIERFHRSRDTSDAAATRRTASRHRDIAGSWSAGVHLALAALVLIGLGGLRAMCERVLRGDLDIVGRALEADESAALAGRPRHARRESVTRSAVAASCAAVLVLGAAASLADWTVREQRRPPLFPLPPVTADTGAAVLNVRLDDRAESLGAFLRRHESTMPSFGRTGLSERGYVFTVRIRLSPDDGQSVPLVWSVVEARTGNPRYAEEYTQIAAVFEPSQPKQVASTPIWVPYPPRAGRYGLDVALVVEDKALSPATVVPRVEFRHTRRAGR